MSSKDRGLCLINKLAFLLILACVDATAAEPLWIVAGRSDKGTTVSFDATRLTRVGSVLNAWVLFTIKEPEVIGGKAYTSQVISIEADCTIKTYRDRGAFYYALPSGNGTLVKSFPEDAATRVAAPNSLIESAITDACNWANTPKKWKPPSTDQAPPPSRPKLPAKPVNPF